MNELGKIRPAALGIGTSLRARPYKRCSIGPSASKSDLDYKGLSLISSLMSVRPTKSTVDNFDHNSGFNAKVSAIVLMATNSKPFT